MPSTAARTALSGPPVLLHPKVSRIRPNHRSTLDIDMDIVMVHLAYVPWIQQLWRLLPPRRSIALVGLAAVAVLVMASQPNTAAAPSTPGLTLITWDPATATPAEMAAHGFPQRPTTPGALAVWLKAMRIASPPVVEKGFRGRDTVVIVP